MCAVPNMAVFCSSLTLCLPAMLLTYFLNDFEMVPVAPVITGITFIFTFHMRFISIVRSLYFRIFWASVLITFLYPVIATSINIHAPFSLSRIIMSSLLFVSLYLLISQYGYLASLTCFNWFWHMFIPVFFFVHFYPCFLAYVLVLLLSLSSSSSSSLLNWQTRHWLGNSWLI